MGLDVAAYLGQLIALMPPGAAWNTDEGTEQRAVLAAIARGLARVDARGDDLLREMQPATAVELLPEWESMYAVPAIPGATLQQRQIIAAWYHSHGGDIKKPHYIELAALLGYTVTIVDYLDAQSDWLCADDDLWEERWQYFTAGLSMAGDYLAQEDAILPWIWEITMVEIPAALSSPTFEQIMADIGPAHIHINYVYP